jgi:hypothetical protein
MDLSASLYKSGYFRLHSELFISTQRSHVIASITKILNAEMDDFGGEMIIHDLIEVPLSVARVPLMCIGWIICLRRQPGYVHPFLPGRGFHHSASSTHPSVHRFAGLRHRH